MFPRVSAVDLGMGRRIDSIAGVGFGFGFGFGRSFYRKREIK
jgi:hypothetical protein